MLSVGVQTSILHPNEVQRILSTPPKPFYVMLSIWFLGAEWNLVKSRFWPHFLTILYIKIEYFSVLYLICRFFLRSVGLYSIKIESIWNISFSCMKIYFEEMFWSLFVTNYCIFWIDRIRCLWRKRYKNHIITLPVKFKKYSDWLQKGIKKFIQHIFIEINKMNEIIKLINLFNIISLS